MNANLETATFDVTLGTDRDNRQEIKGIGYKAALTLVEDFFNKHKDNPIIREAYENCMRSFGFSGFYGGGIAMSVSAYVKKTKSTDPQTCNRRMADFGPWERKEGLDNWDRIGSDRVCSFCGSLHPDDLLALIKERGFQVISPTDKGYKFYVNRPEVPNAGFGAIKYYNYHNTPEFIAQYNELLLNSKKPAQ